MPAAINLKFSEDDQRRQDLFIATCFWNKRGVPPSDSHYADLCYTSLALAATGAMLPSIAEALVGKGDNGKTRWAKSKVRLFGGEEGGCDFVDPGVLFDKNEFRINMKKFLNFLGLIFDEAGDTTGNARFAKKLEASLIKLLLDRKKVIVRPPYAHDPSQHSWPRTAFFLLCNIFPAIPEERAKAWKAWYRRFLLLPLDSSYVTDLAKVDLENGIFLADTDLENFVTSGLYAAMYLKRYIQPHIKDVTEKECIKTCRFPSDALDEFRKEVIGNAMMNTEECDEDKPETEAEPSTKSAELVSDEMAARAAALRLAQAKIVVTNKSRASKLTQLGEPMKRLQNLNRFIGAGVFVEHKNSNGRVFVVYKVPIEGVPANLQPSSFRHGKLQYAPSIDYESGAAVATMP